MKNAFLLGLLLAAIGGDAAPQSSLQKRDPIFFVRDNVEIWCDWEKSGRGVPPKDVIDREYNMNRYEQFKRTSMDGKLETWYVLCSLIFLHLLRFTGDLLADRGGIDLRNMVRAWKEPEHCWKGCQECIQKAQENGASDAHCIQKLMLGWCWSGYKTVG